MVEKDKWTFPCPNPKCEGCTDRITQQVVDADKAAGILPERMQFGLSRLETARVIDPKKNYLPGEKITVMRYLFDHCAKCGQEYCFRIMCTEVPVSIDPKKLLEIPKYMPPENIIKGN